jgi:hypothetical protein
MVSIFYMGKREGKVEGDQEGYERAIQETTIKRLNAVVYIDPAKQGAYEQPSPVTDPALHRRLQAQKRRQQEQQEEEKFKQLLDVNTQELRAIRAHPGGIKRSGVTNKYITQKLNPDNFLLDQAQIPGDARRTNS